jgi:hypothetical protein
MPETRVLRVNPTEPEKEVIAEAAAVIRSGGCQEDLRGQRKTSR